MNEILKGKKILLGITGSIAAYKAALLARELVKNGADVQVIMTKSACEFISPLTLGNLSKKAVSVDMFDKDSQKDGAWHIHSAHEADLMIIAPCSASTIAKLSFGLCDNSLVTVATALPKKIPLLIAPAMDTTMFINPATQRNIEQLKSDGAIIIPPEEGELSSGLMGPGRLPDTEILLKYITDSLENKNNDFGKSKKINTENISDSLDNDKWKAELEFTQLKEKHTNKSLFNFYKNKKVLITAGPTIEKIDDVRYISNHSSGKMGYALAEVAQKFGANVVLVSGPVHLPVPDGVSIRDVTTADEMYNIAKEEFPGTDIAIFAAAVADYSPENPRAGKMKKEIMGDNPSLSLKKTKDILGELSSKKTGKQIIVGFALESENEIENGKKKLRSKKCDMIIVNFANKPDSGFSGDNNTIMIITKDDEVISYNSMPKKECAGVILERIRNIK